MRANPGGVIFGGPGAAALTHVLHRLQADAGAQAVQIFDSWASELAPQDFDVFAGPYIQRIIDSVRQVRLIWQRTRPVSPAWQDCCSSHWVW